MKPSKLLLAAKAMSRIRPPGLQPPARQLDVGAMSKQSPNVPLAQLQPLPSNPGPTALQRPEPTVKKVQPADKPPKA